MSTESSKISLFSDIELDEVVEFDGCLILEEITSTIEKKLKEESNDINATVGILRNNRAW